MVTEVEMPSTGGHRLDEFRNELAQLSWGSVTVTDARVEPMIDSDGEPHGDLVRITEAFVALQEARERADYDHNYPVRRRDALYHVAQARETIRLARKLNDTREKSYVRFLRLMVGAVAIAKQRQS